MDWLTSKGAVVNGLTLKDMNEGIPGAGDDPERRNIGVVVVDNRNDNNNPNENENENGDGGVRDGQEILVVPLEAIICRETAKRFLPTIDLSKINEYDLGALFLMRQRALGRRSPFAPYIELLPRKIPLPMFFT